MTAFFRQRCVVDDKKASLVAYQAVGLLQENSLERSAIPNPFGNKMMKLVIANYVSAKVVLVVGI